MERKIKKIKNIKDGEKVMIVPGSRFDLNIPMNPSNIWGNVYLTGGDWIKVKWPNGKINNYQSLDLIFENDVDSVEIDENKLYLKETPNDLNNLLEILYPEKKKGSSDATYYQIIDSEEKIRHCVEGKMRSFDDIFIIANTYFPETSPAEVMEALLLFNMDESKIYSDKINKSFQNCSTIMRIRYTNSAVDFNTVVEKANCLKYNSMYSWPELFLMLGIKTSKDLRKWYQKKFEKIEKHEEVQVN